MAICNATGVSRTTVYKIKEEIESNSGRTFVKRGRKKINVDPDVEKIKDVLRINPSFTQEEVKDFGQLAFSKN